MLTKLSFKTKLLLLCCMFCGVSVIVGTVGAIGLSKFTDEFTYITNKSIPRLMLVKELRFEFFQVRINIKTLDSRNVTPEQAKSAMRDARNHIAKFAELDKEYVALGFEPGAEAYHDEVLKVWDAYNSHVDHVFNMYEQGSAENQKELTEFFMKTAPELSGKYLKASSALLAQNELRVSEKQHEATRDASRANLIDLLLIIGGAATGLTIGFFFANSMAKNLADISAGLSHGSDLVDQAAASISATSEQLSSSAVEQAAALQETTASLEETNAMVSRNAENAKHSNQVSAKSQRNVADGKQAVSEMVISIEEIAKSNTQVVQQVEEGNREIEAIVKVIAEIGSKTKIINDIVFQTKLLSFNASVEAARAGEHGKGFAVVAEEVGNLAQMSGTAAKEITAMLDDSIQKVEQIVVNTKTRVQNIMQVSQSKVQGGLTTAKRCEDLLEAIVEDVNQVGTMVGDISAASDEQSRGLQEINKAMNQLDEVSQQNSSAANRAATSAQDLKDEVVQLRAMVGQLNTALHGLGATALAPLKIKHPSQKEAEIDHPTASTEMNHSNIIPFERKAATQSMAVPSADDVRFKDV